MNEVEHRALLAQPALEPPDAVEPNFASPPNMNALADGILVAALTVTSLAVLARIHFWVFVLKQPRGRLEAVLVISGFASYIGFAYCLLRIVRLEIGWWVHQGDVTVGAAIGFSYWVYIAGLLYNSGIAPVKVAIVMEWLRIFLPRSRNAFFWLCHISLWLNVAYYIAAIVVESIRCAPRELIWDPTVKGTCLDRKALEAISSINVVSDIAMLVAPLFAIWRLKLSTAKKVGVALLFTVGLFGTVSAIFRLFATQAYLKSQDSTYFVSPVRFWELSEMTSVFIVYGLPAVPTAFAGASTGFSHCYSRWIQGFDPNASNMGPWREGRSGPSIRYRNLDRSSLPVSTLDTATTRCISIIDPDPPRLPESISVVKTVEIRRDKIRTDALGDTDKDIEEDVLLRQHPWFS
ncbi:hypothetical protein E0Z10_g4226 [Xylaria hypoxylon]|uniref:Rhodopsin domain-containing protein n=1 Tax=Xylaria hypoxylon TaxID=37992 RepID=A0A4Z0YZ82_9PEZI|nr:hypothetical protein E0Z10_g4226 [Xylaria hypoxylon]